MSAISSDSHKSITLFVSESQRFYNRRIQEATELTAIFTQT